MHIILIGPTRIGKYSRLYQHPQRNTPQTASWTLSTKLAVGITAVSFAPSKQKRPPDGDPRVYRFGTICMCRCRDARGAGSLLPDLLQRLHKFLQALIAHMFVGCKAQNGFVRH